MVAQVDHLLEAEVLGMAEAEVLAALRLLP